MRTMTPFYLWCYKSLLQIVKPAIWYYLKWRVKIGKEDPIRFPEKLMLHQPPLKPKGKVIWVHAASVGELNSLFPLLKKLIEHSIRTNEHSTFLVTTTTLTSAKLFQESEVYKAHADILIHQFFPLDVASIIRRFLAYWDPQIAIFAESEVWPNTIIETSNKIPVLLVNARMSDRSMKKWCKFRNIARTLFTRFSAILPSTSLDNQRYAEFSPDNIHYIGHLKYDAPELAFDPVKLKYLQERLIDEREYVWVCASTHAGEEEIVLSVHLELKRKFPKLLTILIPRHPARAAELIRLMEKLQLKYKIFSEGIDEVTAETEIYIVNAIGQTGLFYKLAPIIFMGGSMVSVGGHNLFEPARMGCALITGPHTHNFVEMVSHLQEHNALLIAHNTAEIVSHLTRLFEDIEYRTALQNAALQAATSQNGILDQTVEFIVHYL